MFSIRIHYQASMVYEKSLQKLDWVLWWAFLENILLYLMAYVQHFFPQVLWIPSAHVDILSGNKMLSISFTCPISCTWTRKSNSTHKLWTFLPFIEWEVKGIQDCSVYVENTKLLLWLKDRWPSWKNYTLLIKEIFKNKGKHKGGELIRFH